MAVSSTDIRDIGELPLGKKPPEKDPRTFQMTDYTTAVPTVPAEVSWLGSLTFDALGNTNYGDCVEAGYGHFQQVIDTDAGKPYVPSEGQALYAAQQITGQNPKSANFPGTSMLAANKYWRNTGMAGRKITAFLAVQPTHTFNVKLSVASYACLYTGAAMPLNAQDQVGHVWEVVPGAGSSAGSWGGHCFPIFAYDADGLWCVTWGMLQRMTWEWLQTYADEAYCLLSTHWLETTGKSPSGLTWGQLTADLGQV